MLIGNPNTADVVSVLAASTAAQATDNPAVVALHPSSPLPAGTAVIGHVITDTNSISTVTQGTAAAATAPWYDSPGTPTTSKLSQIAISFSGSGANTIVAASGSKTTRIFRLLLVVAGATNVTLQDTAGSPVTFTGAIPLFPGGSITLGFEGDPHFVTASSTGFAVNSSAAVQVSGCVWYTQS